jgi:hypothetical protein
VKSGWTIIKQTVTRDNKASNVCTMQYKCVHVTIVGMEKHNVLHILNVSVSL